MTPRDLVAAFVVILIWALNFSIAKIGMAQIPPLLMMTLRFSLLAVLMVPFLKPPRDKPFRLVLGVGIALGGFHFGLLFTGLSGIDAAAAAIAIELAIPFSAILAAVFFKERLNTWQIFGMAIAFAGIYLLSGEPRSTSSIPHLLMVIAAAYAWAQANVFIKRLGGINPFTLNAWVAVLAVPQFLAATLVFETGHMEALEAADWRGWGAILFMVFGASITAYGFWYYLIGKYDINRVVPLTLLAPVLAVIFASFILGEELTPRLLAGGLVTLAGVSMIEFLKSRRAGASLP